MFESYETAESMSEAPVRGLPSGADPAIRNICVLCASRAGYDPALAAAGKYLGIALARDGIGLVCDDGGGLIGTIARAALAAGGRVTAVMPAFIGEREDVLQGDYEIIVDDDMHSRKRMIFERADAFVALPGGIETLQELIGQMTCAQSGERRKPLLLVDVNGFWQPLLTLLQNMCDAGFAQPDSPVFPQVSAEVEDILPMLQATRLDSRAAASRRPAARLFAAARSAPTLIDFGLTGDEPQDAEPDVYECRPPSPPQPWESRP